MTATKYSGRTTSYEHRTGNWKKTPGAGDDCIRQMTVFEVQWSNCPDEVAEEVKRMWANYEHGNDTVYHDWNSMEMGEDYPIIDEYLKSRGVTECKIHWWW